MNKSWSMNYQIPPTKVTNDVKVARTTEGYLLPSARIPHKSFSHFTSQYWSFMHNKFVYFRLPPEYNYILQKIQPIYFLLRQVWSGSPEPSTIGGPFQPRKSLKLLDE